MKKYKVEIIGTTPYMQHRMDDETLDEWEKRRGPIIERPDVSQPDNVRAEFHSYYDIKEKKHFLPSEHLRGAMINAGGYLKAKVGNSKKSMKNIVAAMFFVNPEKIWLPPWDIIDKRSAWNRKVGARIIVIRPKWNNLKVKFELWIDNDTITKATIEDVLQYAGSYCGIGSFRPEKNGMFGRFVVKNMKEIK